MSRRVLAAAAAFVVSLGAAAAAAADSLERSPAIEPRIGSPILFGFADSSAVAPFPGAATPQKLAALEAAAGGEIARLSIRWDRVERHPPNLILGHSYDWSLYAPQIEAFRAQGIATVAVIIDAPKWANDNAPACQSPDTTCPPEPAHVADFGSFAAALVERFNGQGLGAVEVWNEPNLELLWNTASGPDPARFATLFATARTAIRAVDPDLPVIVGGLTVPPFNANTKTDMGIAAYLDAFYKELPTGVLDPAVGVGFHAYPGYKLDRGSGNKLFKRALRQTVAVTRAHDPNRPLWATELGQSTTDARSKRPPSQRRQALTILRMLEKVDAEPRAVAAMIYTVVERPKSTGGQSGFGVVGRGPAFKPKRAYCLLASERGMPRPAGC